MKLNEMFPSNYVQKEDCGDTGIIVTITGISMEDVSRENEPTEIKPVVTFSEVKPLVLNKTNGKALAGYLSSDDADHWIGKQIVLFNDLTVEFNGVIGGIRVRPVQAAAPVQAQVAAIAAAHTTVVKEDSLDSDIPGFD